MRISIGKVSGYVLTEDGYRFTAEHGRLDIVPVSERIIRVEYSIDGYTVPQFLSDSSKTLYSCEKQAIKADISEIPDGWMLSFGKVSVEVSKDNALVTVFREGRAVHGGRAGGKDTVIPQSQFLLSGGRGSETGTFVFSLGQSERFFGLGDKAGIPDHRGKRLRMYNKDALGYDASFSDPLYKSIPFILRSDGKTGTCTGLFFPETCIKAVDLGKESPFYWSADVLGGPFCYFLILGSDYKEILKGYCSLTGLPVFPPLYSFGYLGSSMNYVEAWDAQERIRRFFSDVESHDLPCEGMYVSSGYLKSDEGYRHAFMWNRRKFPDPGAFLDELSGRGYHLTFNIKPGILKTHPWYGELAEKGYFIKDNDGKPVVEYFWGGYASFIDFSNADAVSWWKEQLKKSYLNHGVEGIWNDNNEFEMSDPEMDAYRTRTLYPVEMARASFEACLEKNPSKRPWIYSRSGYAGMQRYARTWTGDNSSDFRTLRYNQFQGISLGLSGVPFVGHDLGGFYGPEPSAELLVRCAQSAIFQSRFVIHSWRENDQPTEPWKFKEVFPLIKQALSDHYRHMPYIYNEAHKAALTGVPLERLLCLEYPSDHALEPETEQFIFGDSVMKAPVLNEGQVTKHVRFPEGDNWYSPKLGTLFNGGEEIDLEAPLHTSWYFYKAGSVIPRSCEISRLTTGFFKALELMVIPKDGTFTYEYFEDDGISVESPESHNIWTFTVTYSSGAQKGEIKARCAHLGSKDSLKGREVRITLPPGFEGGAVLEMSRLDGAVLTFSGIYM